MWLDILLPFRVLLPVGKINFGKELEHTQTQSRTRVLLALELIARFLFPDGFFECTV